MSKIFTPVNQIRLTNVAVVRLKRKGKRYEIACYKNKVVNWRNGVEKNIDEVVQSENVYLNVSKGILANTKQLEGAFGTTDIDKIIRVILEKGQLQVSQKERQQEFESKSKDVATIIAEKCVNTETQRPFSVRQIESALAEINYSVKPNKSAKQQALTAIDALKTAGIPIDKAQMRLRMIGPSKIGKQLKDGLTALGATLEDTSNTGANFEVVFVSDPGHYRDIDELGQRLSRGKCTLEILDFQVRERGENQL